MGWNPGQCQQQHNRVLKSINYGGRVHRFESCFCYFLCDLGKLLCDLGKLFNLSVLCSLMHKINIMTIMPCRSIVQIQYIQCIKTLNSYWVRPEENHWCQISVYDQSFSAFLSVTWITGVKSF